MKRSFFILLSIVLLSSCSNVRDGEYKLEILTTNDVHGAWFDSTYVGGSIRNSLFAVNSVVDSVRRAVGEDNVLLLDAGDCLQGDNASYYFNYVDTTAEHLFVRLAHYMKYDAVVVGNHDVETGHKVYDRVTSELKNYGIPFLAGNAVRNDNGKPYFPQYKSFVRGGLKVTVLGFTNPNMAAWLSESLWSGMSFKSLIPLVQDEVDRIVKREKPHIVVVMTHSGVGNGDGSSLESQGLDLFKSLKGVDVLVCSHDHRPVYFNDSERGICLVNSGSHSRNVGSVVANITISGGKVVCKKIEAGLIPVNREKVDTAMRRFFHPDYLKVKAFTLQPVGRNDLPLCSRACYVGQADYMNLIHTIQLRCAPAQISFAAPLKHDGFVPAGDLVFNDLFTIYPFENQLYVMKMTGEEILKCMEYSYDHWIQTATKPSDHVLRICLKCDTRNGNNAWSFAYPSFNFDSVGGLNYEVDVTRPYGSRIINVTFADGKPFEPSREYNVAMTSYRANGGGNIIPEGAGIRDHDERIVARYPEIRSLLYDFIRNYGQIDEKSIRNYSKIGSWRFVPENIAGPALKNDINLVFDK